MEQALLNEKKNDIRAYQTAKRLKSTKTKYKVTKTVLYTFLAIYALISIYPFIWAFVVSFMNPNRIPDIGISPFVKNPGWTSSNYSTLFTAGMSSQYAGHWIVNSIVYSTVNATINCFFNFLAGYALARMTFKGRNVIIWYILVALMIPSQATQIPQYLILLKLGIINANIPTTIWMIGILTTGLTSGILIFQVRQFYLNQSASIEEAGLIDGLSRFRVFMKISLKSMLPVLAMQWAAVFIGSWNNFILFQLWSVGMPERFNLQTGITLLSQTRNGVEGQGKALAATNISVLPVLVVYMTSLHFQKRVMVNGEK